MGVDEDLFHAVPQTQGKASHTNIDEKRYSSRKDELSGISIYSNELEIAGKIDIYKGAEKLLVERKYQLRTIYQGQIYQLWAQYFCMIEMGYTIEKLAFYSMKDNKTFPIELPGNSGKTELKYFIEKFKRFDPEQKVHINENKCRHCIYCSLCDKINIENVYT